MTIGLSDQGRSVLAAKIGPGAHRVSGRVVQVSDSALTLGVTGVQYIASGSMTRWNGELVTVPRGFLSGLEEKQFSKRRTWIAVGVVTAAVVMASFLAINGFGQGESVERPIPNPEPQ